MDAHAHGDVCIVVEGDGVGQSLVAAHNGWAFEIGAFDEVGTDGGLKRLNSLVRIG